MKVVIIIPTYNEKGNIEKIIRILEEEIFPKIKNHEMHIVVADDNSPDGTGKIVEGLIKKYKNLHLIKGEKHGLGAAYVRAMGIVIEKLHADVMFEMDADLSHDPKKIPEFLKKIDEGYDMVIGTRYSQGGSIPPNWGFIRKVYSIFGNVLVRSILMRFSIHDWTGGFRALKKEVFLKEKSELTAFKGYTFQVSFLHKAVRDGFKIAEVPIAFTDRTLGRSKIVPKEYIVDLLKYVIISRFKELERFIKFLIVGGTGFLVQLLTQEGSVRLGIIHSLSVGIGAESAIISNFLLNHFWTFGDTKHIKESANFFIKLLTFNSTSLGSIFIQVAAVWIAEQILGDTTSLLFFTVPTRILILFPTIIFLVIPLNYLIYNKIIWKTQYLKDEQASKA